MPLVPVAPSPPRDPYRQSTGAPWTPSVGDSPRTMVSYPELPVTSALHAIEEVTEVRTPVAPAQAARGAYAAFPSSAGLRSAHTVQ